MKKKAVFIIFPLLTAVLLCSCIKIRIRLPFQSETETEAPDTYTGEVDVPVYGGAERYACSTLDTEQKELYGRILDAAVNLKEYVEITDAKEAEYVYKAVFFDHAELFFLSEEPQFDAGKLVFRYVFSLSQIREISEGLDTAYNDFVSSEIKDGMDDYDKFFAIYTYIVNVTKYAHEEGDLFEENVFNNKVYRSMCAAGPLIDRYSICTGYARATQYLCQRLGITCFTINGRGNNGAHYFNLVLLNGEFYYSDTTWGDPVGSDRSKDYLTYYYFCTTTEETFRTHTVLSVIPMPLCTATECNYYYKNGLVAKSAEEAAEMAYRAYMRKELELRVKVDHAKLDEIYDGMSEAINGVFRKHDTYNVRYSVSKSDGPSLISVFFR